MIQISMPYIVEFVAALDQLSNVHRARTYGDVSGYLYNARVQIDNLFGSSLYSSNLRSSRQLASTLWANIQTALAKPHTDFVDSLDEWQVQSNRDRFRTAFLAELGVMPSFFVTQKGGFDTVTLLGNAHALFPADLLLKVPETAADVSAAGKALAFDLGTASGFHIFRVLEAVLRRYYKQVAGGLAAPKVRSLGTYIAALERAKCGDPMVLATLKQIKDLHRNPLVHPETLLSVDQAVSLFGVVRSAIEAMLTSLPLIVPSAPPMPQSAPSVSSPNHP